MVANPDSIVSRFVKMCCDLMASVRQSAPGTSAYEMETQIFRDVLQLGALLMEAFLQGQAPHYRWGVAHHPNGFDLSYVGERRGLFYSAFGEIRFVRSYYSGDNQGFYPMDAALNLPVKGDSDFLRTMKSDLSLEMSYERATVHVAKYFPVATSTRAVQDAIQTDSMDAEAYYAQAPAPPAVGDATILVVQADGKGVPMVKAALSASSLKQAAAIEPKPGLLKGAPQREGKKKEATAISVALHKPFIRTAEQVVAGLFKEHNAPDAASETVYSGPRDAPVHKRVWATLDGKASALRQARLWAHQADSDHVQHRVTLTDGLPSLQHSVDREFPECTRVLDLMHALSYLWKAADVRFGNCKAGKAWVRDSVLLMLRGQVAAVIDEVDNWHSETKSAGKLTLKTTVDYFRRNRDAMAYDRYLAKGWPIATGMIEGTCRHIVKDRCERSGMRWTYDGAEAILHLRCINHNGDWEDYHRFRRQQRQAQYYGITPKSGPSLQETHVHLFNASHEYANAA